MKIKIGRNSPCPCGSGKKYKHCHGALASAQTEQISPIPKSVLQHAMQQIDAMERQRKFQQGKGRPIVSYSDGETRFVAVGGNLMWSKKWKTFHDFLFHYIKAVMPDEWGNKELKKPFSERHPILQWYQNVCEEQQRAIKTPGVVASITMTGAMAAYTGLAYNLYLLAHNAELQSRLIKRLINPEQFRGAYYETFVAASFIKAGFNIELEDESARSETVCEFVATHPRTGRKFSVEAKAKNSSEKTAGNSGDIKLWQQLKKALEKKARYDRVVFIDVNIPDKITGNDEASWLATALNELRSEEKTLQINGQPAPEAYVFVTNLPYHHAPNSKDFRVAILAEGFKIPDFKREAGFATLREALDSRDSHIEMYELMEDLHKSQNPPSTFDGAIPDFAFREHPEARLLIGQKYLVPDENGIERPGTLKDAVVMEPKKTVWGTYWMDDGQAVIASTPLTDEEMRIYQEYPDTFFGVHKEVSASPKDPVDWYDFMYKTYKKSTKEKLLEFMAESNDIERLRELPQNELARIYCEGLVYGMLKSRELKTEKNNKE